MGEVYLAGDTTLGRTVALKIFRPEGADGPQKLRRFMQEARAAAQIGHPNITHIYEIVELPELSFIAMEYVDGETLHRRLRQGPLELTLVIDIAIQVAGTLEAAHNCGVVHRDIKSENIMVTRRGYVKVLDFGLAKFVEHDPHDADHFASTVSRPLTNPNVVMGTVSYMSPEQARGHAVDARTDIWSLGVVLYEMAAGRPPFEASTSSDMVASILYKEPPALARFSPETPEALEWIIRKALTKKREERYQTARELLADLIKLQQRIAATSGEYDGLTHGNGWGIAGHTTAERGATDENGQPRLTSGGEGLLGGVWRRLPTAAVALGLSVAVVTAALFLLFIRSRGARQQSPQHTLSRVAFDSDLRQGRATLQSGPTWSPDGRFVAYASNRGDASDFNIWVQQADGGNPARVTSSSYNDWQPDWSPDGKLIAFRSEREDSSGVFLVPALGGMERRLTNFGYRPRWSPDGSKILFLDWGDRVVEYPRLFVKEMGDAPPFEVPTNAGDEYGVKLGAVAWHPDGLRISYLGVDGQLWITHAEEGAKPVKVEMSDDVKARILETGVDFVGLAWAPSGDALYLVGRARGLSDIWRIDVDRESLRWVGGPERVTTGLGRVSDLSVSRDGRRLAFCVLEQKTRIWMFPFDGKLGKLTPGEQPTPVTDENLEPLFSDLTPDGNAMVFAARRPGLDRQELWLRTMKDGSESLLQSDDETRFFPRWSPDGKRLAYSRFKRINRQSGERAGPIVLWDARNGGEEQLVTSSGNTRDYVYDWSPDGRWLLASTNRRAGDRWEVCMFPLDAAPSAEREMRVVTSDPERSLWAPRFSPDGRWVSYVSQQTYGAKDSILYAAPSEGGTPVALTAPGVWCDWPRWSLDGKLIYFVSNYKSSFLSVWAVPFDAEGGRAGTPFRVTNFGSPAHMISPRLAVSEMTVSRKQLALPVTDVMGHVWVLDNLTP